MKKIYNVVCATLLISSGFVHAAVSPIVGSAQGAVQLPLISTTIEPSSAKALTESVVAEKLMSEKPVDIDETGEVKPKEPADLKSVTDIKNVDDLAAFMKKFKDDEINKILAVIVGLEKMLNEAERALSANKDPDPIPLLVRWAKIKSALEGERQVLAAVKGMPEEMAYPEEELKCGYDQAKKTIETIDKVNKERVIGALKNCQDYASPKKDAEKRKTVFMQGRDDLASYYEMTISLYDDFLRMIDGLWLTSAHAFVKQKGEEIACLQNKLGGASKLQSAVLAGAEKLLGSTKFKKRIEKECADEEKRKAKEAVYKQKIEKFRTQQKAIWQNEGAVVGKRELIEQRNVDWQEAQAAENEVRKAKGKLNEEWLKTATHVTNKAWDDYLKDQGRYDLEQVINQAREALRGVVRDVRAIDENNLEGTDASRRGVRVLVHEAGMFNQAKYVGDVAMGNSFFTHMAMGLSKHIALFKEMKPVSSEFETRLRAVSRIYPGVAIALPTVRFLANKYAPGIIDVWA